MKIQSVRIKNFRTLEDVSIDFDKVTTFIGPNGAGKSSVLRALDWFFNGKQGELSGGDCSFGKTDESIEVQVTFCELTSRDREELGKYAPQGAATFTAWKRRSPDGSETLSANSKSYPGFNDIKSAGSAREKQSQYKALRVAQPDLGLPTATSGIAVDQAMTEWESAHTDQLTDAPEALQTNFFGFNSGGKMSGLFDFVLVTADLRAGEESVDAKASIIGRILERSVDRSAADEEIAEIVKESRQRQQQVYDDKFKSQLDAMTKQLNGVVQNYAPGRQINVVPSEVELKAPRTTFSVSVIDGTTETEVDRQGHGFQRTLLISALQVLAQSGNGADDGFICLAIEEPELFQHPIQAQTFAKVLRSLAEDESKHMQVTYATHSPYFVEARHFDQVRRLTRSANPDVEVRINSATVDDIKKRLTNVTKPAVVDRQLDTTIANQLPVALFAHRTLVVEGTTESAVLHGLGDRQAIGSLEAAGISVVPVGGKSTIPLAHAILTGLGIPCYALFDGDGGFEERARTNGKNQEKIEEERRAHISSNHSVLRYFGAEEVDFPDQCIADDYAVFADHLEGFLAKEWPEWAGSCSEIEKESGVTLKKNQAAYRTVTLRAEGTVPTMLNEVLARSRGVSGQDVDN